MKKHHIIVAFLFGVYIGQRKMLYKLSENIPDIFFAAIMILFILYSVWYYFQEREGSGSKEE